jgi:DNA-binding IscR family transcriptional regulator
MLSQKAKYAMRALLYLAQAQPENPVFISEIADQQSVPKKFLELILLDLKRHGLVHSYRGPLAQLPCASRTAYRRCDDCENEQTCEIRRVMLQVRDSTARILDNTSLADVMVRGTAELVEGAGI